MESEAIPWNLIEIILSFTLEKQWWIENLQKRQKNLKSVQENVEDRGRLKRCRWRWWSLLLSLRVCHCVTSVTLCQVIYPDPWLSSLWSQTARRRSGALEITEEGHLVTRTTHPYVICRDFASCAISGKLSWEDRQPHYLCRTYFIRERYCLSNVRLGFNNFFSQFFIFDFLV